MTAAKRKSIDKAAAPESARSRIGSQRSPSACAPPVGEYLEPQAAGNLAVQRLFRSGAIQARLDVSRPDDRDEQEADRVAERILTVPDPAHQSGGVAGDRVPRDTCAQVGPTIRRRTSTAGGDSRLPHSIERVPGFGVGRPLDRASQTFMESRFGRDFGDVRIHTDGEAAASARALDAQAYTFGRDIVFAAGAYRPDSGYGLNLLAHELTHVVQQDHEVRPTTIRRQAADAPAPAASPGTASNSATASGTQSSSAAAGDQSRANHPRGLIVEDAAQDPDPSQMKRGQFLSQARSAAYSAADQAVAGSSWAAIARAQVGQQIEALFGAYNGQDGATLERSIREQIPGAGGVTTAGAFIPLIAEQVRQRVADGVPKDDAGAGLLQTGASVVSSAAQNVLNKLSALGGILLKTKHGGSDSGADPRATKMALGEGRSLDGPIRSRMESAFKLNFSNVRVHTGAKAAKLSSKFGARAFTVGSDIAFGADEYHPGTLVGDALIAHELAHVVQQGQAASSSPMARQSTSARASDALEEDADTAAVGAVAALWNGTRDVVSRLGLNAVPALRSGLRLQRCAKEKPLKQQQEELGKQISEKMGSINRAHTLDSGLWYWPGYRTECERNDPGRWDEAKYRTGFTAAPQFEKTGVFQWTLKSGSASAAIQAWLKGLTIADCASAATAVYYDTLRADVGDKNFDDYFGINTKNKLVISQYPEEIPLKGFLRSVEQQDTLVVGDWYYWKNHPAYKYKHPAGLWQGENAVYRGQVDGKDNWDGFGAESMTAEAMLETLTREYNSDRTPDDLRRLEDKKQEHGGTLPPEYAFRDEGGTLIRKLDSPQDILKAGGGRQAEGLRLNALSVMGLRKK